MKVMNYRDVLAEEVAEEGAVGATIRWLITREDGAPNFSMRHFELAPGGSTPRHDHDWEHEVFILHGNGSVVREGEDVPLREGDLVFIPPGEEHQFKNSSDSPLTLICLIPNPE
jgi:quercetin dioxygenase-like cupin family protein